MAIEDMKFIVLKNGCSLTNLYFDAAHWPDCYVDKSHIADLSSSQIAEASINMLAD
jgi:hypothetical protein